MYNKFFGFKEKPFRLAPDPKFLFLGKSHEDVLAHLLLAVSHGKDSVLVTGEAGTGKTTLCTAFFTNLDMPIKATHTVTPKLDGLQFLKAVTDDFWIDSTPGNTKEDLTDKLQDFLIKKKDAGKKVVLLLDEAQNLSPEALEQLNILSGFENTQGKLLQIILVGEPELGDLLSSSHAGQMKERFTKKYRLDPLTFQETIDYIRHRISAASLKKGPSFDKAACRAIHDYSKGVPKLINMACELALQNAHKRKSAKITGAIAREAIRTLSREKAEKPRRRRSRKIPRLALFAAALVPLVIFLLYFAKGQFMETAVTGESADKITAKEGSVAMNSISHKPEPPEEPLAADQGMPREKSLEQSPAAPEPSAPVAEITEIPEKAQADIQEEPAEKNTETVDVHSVHAGSFNTASEANELLNTLKSLGFPSFGYSSLNRDGSTVHVVVAGKYDSYDLAEEASRSLREKGHSNFIARAKDSLKIPAGSKPIDLAADIPESPEEPPAADQENAAEKNSENGDAYSVHAGTFTVSSEAEKLARNLKSLGFPSFMYTSTNKKGNTVYVVVAGQYQSYDIAREASRNLSHNGHSNFIARAKDSLRAGSAP